MSAPIIRVEGLGKRFTLQHKQRERYTALRDVLSDRARSLFRPSKDQAVTSEFWALKDLSFDISPGDRVGIIGRNGAGKSTLLKVLSRIVDPTAGRVTIEGRLASLLEVGTGFHPELSGRENIYLNGAILGMSRKEISSKFDEIVAFADVERFLDTPVKRYSSGMYVRLAFAVAAHLEPEILVVDEVLAVGDAEFQRKCLGKMKEVSLGGRTVLFVSHNMAAIQNLCSTAIYLKQGRLVTQGDTAQVLSTYLKDTGAAARVDLSARQDRQGNGAIRFTGFHLADEGGRELAAAQSGSTVVFNFDMDVRSADVRDLKVAMGIDDQYGQRITHLSNEVSGQALNNASGNARLSIRVPRCPLRNGNYTFTLFSTVNGDIADYLLNAGGFHVESGDFFGTGRAPAEDQGTFFMDHSFKLDK
ncbi:MAG: ABC transporter ATP-binding protein [Flavobacteriales bacterium]|nr:ABC transporter ATP-binding protein [Flavobacteriales bacterium]